MKLFILHKIKFCQNKKRMHSFFYPVDRNFLISNQEYSTNYRYKIQIFWKKSTRNFLFVYGSYARNENELFFFSLLITKIFLCPPKNNLIECST